MALARSILHAFVSGVADSGDATLLQPSNWNASHSVAVTGAVSGGIPYFDSATSEATSALLASGGVVLGGGAGGAPNTSANLTFNGTALTIVNGTATGLVLGAGSASTPSMTFGDTNTGWYQRSANFWTFVASGNFQVDMSNSLFAFQSGLALGWTPSTVVAALDTGLSRIAAAVVGVGTGAAGNSSGSFRGKYQSSDGTAGVASFGPAAVASITVKDGIITAIS